MYLLSENSICQEPPSLVVLQSPPLIVPKRVGGEVAPVAARPLKPSEPPMSARCVQEFPSSELRNRLPVLSPTYTVPAAAGETARAQA